MIVRGRPPKSAQVSDDWVDKYRVKHIRSEKRNAGPIQTKMVYTDPRETDVHDRLQVIATAKAIARHDLAGTLGALFAAPAPEESILYEEGWILGAP